jgi:hypothetical protein
MRAKRKLIEVELKFTKMLAFKGRDAKPFRM